MTAKVKIFVSYSHKDAAYLEDDSLLGFLKGLQQNGVEFWDDRQIRAGELWDEVIKSSLSDSQIALVLISQAFLDSDYCQKTEIEHLLAHKAHLLPVILSPCEWRRHDWLKSRQFLPGGDKTVEEHFKDSGDRKRFFLEVRNALRERLELVQSVRATLLPSVPLPSTNALHATKAFSGKTKLAFCQRLGANWRELADYLEIPVSDQARFEQGNEARRIWEWLQNRHRLNLIVEALPYIGREDLAELFQT